MKTFATSAPKLLVVLICLLYSSAASLRAQQVARMTPFGRGFLEHLPANYSTSTETYPCIIFLHGSGERGDGSPSALNLLLRNGVPKFINQGSTMCFNINGKDECFIVLSPQQGTNKGGWKGDIMPFIKWAFTKYRIDPSRLFVTGLSMGGNGTWVTASDAANSPNYIAAMAPVSAYGSASDGCITAQLKIPVWAFHGDLDKTLTLSRGLAPIKGMTPCNPDPLPIFTVIVNGGHNAYTWDRAYSPTHTYFNPNVYEWFLAHKLGVSLPQPPVVSAGVDKSITLPINSVTVTGTASDPDGTIVSTTWVKVSGPNTPTITSSSSLSTSITGLVQGTYVFSLSALDNTGLTSSDQVTVTVAPLPPKYPPVADAGLDQQITLPTNAIVITGSGKDSDGSVVSYLWKQDSGPAVSLSGTSSTTLNVTNLVVGSYTFSLKVTDNDVLSGTDQMVLTVFAAPPNAPPVADAGVDQEITLPVNSVSLAGTGKDSDGTVAAYKWVKTSGPASGTITTDTQPNTTVTNLTEGVYVFTLTVTDNLGSTNPDQVKVTVLPIPPNNPPVASAGTDIEITLPVNNALLNGSGVDSDGSIAGYLWEQTQGPNTATFTSTSIDKPTVSNLIVGNYTFTLTVTDNKGSTNADQVVVKVLPVPPNKPPVADAGPDKNITLPTNSVTLTGTGTDEDGTIALYKWVQQSGPTTATISTAAAGTTLVKDLAEGVYTFEFTVTDNKGDIGSDQVTINVFPKANIPPVADAGSDVNITLPISTTSLTGSGTDSDGTIAAYLWEQVSGPSSAVFSSITVSAVTVNSLISGIYIFSLTVTDDKGDKASDQVTVTVAPEPPNQPPVADAGLDKNLTLPTDFVTLAGSGTDTDGTVDEYLWILQSGPAQIDVSDLTQPVLDISNLTTGIYVFSLVVTDNRGATASDEVKVFVNAANKSPIATAGVDQEITLPTNSVILIGTASDPDGTVASTLWEQVNGPNTSTIVSAQALKTTISGLVEGIYVFNFWVTDNDGIADYDQVQVKVNPAPPNKPPIAVVGPDVEITLPTNSVSFTGSGTDSDGTITAYKWSQVSGPNTAGGGNLNLPAVTFTNLIAGTYTFRLTVTDDKNAKGQKDVKVKVNPQPANVPPVADAGADITITLPLNNTTLEGSGADSDGSITAYNWTQITGPSIATLSASTSAITSANNLVEGIYVLRLTVTDNKGVTSFDEVSVIVKPIPANLPPIANAGGNKIITLPANSAILTGSGTDIDGTITDYNWVLISGPTTPTTTSLTQPSLTISNLSLGIYVFRLTVTDDKGSTGFDEVNVRVQPIPANQPPTANAGSNKLITLPTNAVDFEGSGNDPDGSISSYSWTLIDGPTTPTITGNNASATLSIKDLVEGTYIYRLTVTDDLGASGFDEVNVRVNPTPPNDPPVAHAGTNLSITLPVNTKVITGSGTDSDGTIQSYQWAQESAGPNTAILTDANTSAVTTSGLIAGVYTFRLTVTDNNNADAFDEILLTVNPAPPNKPPVANAGNDQFQILPLTSISLSGVASDADGTISLVNWTQLSGPNTSTIDNSASLSTTVGSLVQGTYVFQLKVTDNSGDTGTDEVTVEIRDNQPPVAFAGDSIKITLPTNTTLVSGSGIDPDGTISLYEWIQDSGPNQPTIDNPNQSTATISSLQVGTYVFTLKVTDNKNSTATDNIVIIVLPPVGGGTAPVANAGDDIAIMLPLNTATLHGTGKDEDGSIVSYLWTQLSGPSTPLINDTSLPDITLADLQEGTYEYELTVTDNDALTGVDQVLINVLPFALTDTKIPRIYSPAKGEPWKWPDLTPYENCTVTIYNRVGAKVFEAAPYENNWDGTRNGKPLEADAYYYIISCGASNMTGGVRLIR